MQVSQPAFPPHRSPSLAVLVVIRDMHSHCAVSEIRVKCAFDSLLFFRHAFAWQTSDPNIILSAMSFAVGFSTQSSVASGFLAQQVFSLLGILS